MTTDDPLMTPDGSCFADEIRIWLRAKGYRVNADFRTGSRYPYVEDSSIPVLQCSAGLVNTFVLLQQFEWALERRAFEDDLWVGARGAIALPCMQVLTTARGPFPTGGCARSDRAAHRGGA